MSTAGRHAGGHRRRLDAGRGRLASRSTSRPTSPSSTSSTRQRRRGDHRPVPAVAVGAAAAAAPGAVGGGLRQPGRHRVLRRGAGADHGRGRRRSRRSTRCTSAPRAASTWSASAPTRCARRWAATRSTPTLHGRSSGVGHEETAGEPGTPGLDHAGARRVPGRLRPRPGAAGQLRVLRQPDRRTARWSWSTRCRRGERPHPTRGAPLTDFRTVELELAGIFPDLAADRGRAPSAAPETLRGAQLAARARLDRAGDAGHAARPAGPAGEEVDDRASATTSRRTRSPRCSPGAGVARAPGTSTTYEQLEGYTGAAEGAHRPPGPADRAGQGLRACAAAAARASRPA